MSHRCSRERAGHARAFAHRCRQFLARAQLRFQGERRVGEAAVAGRGAQVRERRRERQPAFHRRGERPADARGEALHQVGPHERQAKQQRIHPCAPGHLPAHDVERHDHGERGPDVPVRHDGVGDRDQHQRRCGQVGAERGEHLLERRHHENHHRGDQHEQDCCDDQRPGERTAQGGALQRMRLVVGGDELQGLGQRLLGFGGADQRDRLRREARRMGLERRRQRAAGRERRAQLGDEPRLRRAELAVPGEDGERVVQRQAAALGLRELPEERRNRGRGNARRLHPRFPVRQADASSGSGRSPVAAGARATQPSGTAPRPQIHSATTPSPSLRNAG